MFSDPGSGRPSMLTARPAPAPVSGRCPMAPTDNTPGIAPTSWPGPVVYYPSSPLAELRALLPEASFTFTFCPANRLKSSTLYNSRSSPGEDTSKR